MELNVGKKQYLLYCLLFLIVAFAAALVQNYIRYGSHDEYDVWKSIIYLIISLLLFSFFMPLIVHVSAESALKYRKFYVLYISMLAVACITIYYFATSVIIHLTGFYDGFLSEQYARQYFGREAIVHVLMVGVTGFYCYVRGSGGKEKLISATSGRKEITIFTKDIHWIEAYDHYLKIHSEHGPLLKRTTLENMTKELRPDFIRIHRKYLVNKEQIVRKEKQSRDEFVILQSGDRLKVGRSYSPLEW